MAHYRVDRAALQRAIDEKDRAVLSWYIEASEDCPVPELDADARRAYFQLQLQAESSKASSTGVNPVYGQLPTTAQTAALQPPHAVLRQQLAASVASSRTSSVQSAASVSLGNSLLATPSLREATAARHDNSKELPLMLHRKLNRKLFRGYGGYLGDEALSERHHKMWNSTIVDGHVEPHAHASPKADTSTFLLRHISEVTSSPKTIMLHQKNVDLREDEERVDIAQLESYEFMLLADLAREDFHRALRRQQSCEAIALETLEGRERLRITSLQVELWSAFVHTVHLWSNGAAKAQNAMLMNESVLRTRIGVEETHARRTIVIVHKREAEHQLAEFRRLGALEREHQKATVMHQRLMMQLAAQGVDIGSISSQQAVSPARAAVKVLGVDPSVVRVGPRRPPLPSAMLPKNTAASRHPPGGCEVQ